MISGAADKRIFYLLSTVLYRYMPGLWLTSFFNGTYYTFSYDGMGNPTTYKNSSLSWTRGRMLKSGTQKGNSFTYKYDAENLRYEKTVNGATTRYYYNAGQLQAEERGDEFIYYLYGIEGIAGMIYDGQYYIYEKNILGDVIGIYDSNRVKVATYDYDAWGNVVRKSGTMADVNPIRYRGYYYDAETGFYYLNTRYYDPEIRRFVNADNYELLPELAGVYGQVNLYNYCNNNPVMYTDPTGESWSDFWGWVTTGFMTIGAVALIGVAAFTSVATFGALPAIMIGAGVGALAGMSGSIISQGGFANANPWNVAISGAIGGTIGAVSGAASYGFSAIGQGIGQTLGGALSGIPALSSIPTKAMTGMFMSAGATIGGIAGGSAGGMLANNMVNRLVSNIAGPEYMVDNPNWMRSGLINFFKWLNPLY